MKKILSLIILFPGLFLSIVNAQITTSSFASGVNFTTGTTASSNPNHSAAADLDGDGKIDLVVPNSGESDISVFRNTSTIGTVNSSTFSKTDISCLSVPDKITLTDMDGDGKIDIVLGYASATVFYFSVFRNTTTTIGSISFATRQDFSLPTAIGLVIAADLDGDGKQDLILSDFSNNYLRIFRNTTTSVGSISFGTVQNISTTTAPAQFVARDFDGDGKIDLAVAQYLGSGLVYVYRNTTTTVGSITMGTPLSLTAGSFPNGLTSMDVDGDGKQDIIAANFIGASLSVFRNTSSTGTISFSTQVTFATAGTQGPQDMGYADFDGDGKLDLVVGNYTSTNAVSVFRNTSSTGTITSSSFATRVDFSAGTGTEAMTFDVDGDGKSDLVSNNRTSNNVSIIRNIIIATSPTIGGSAISFSSIANTSMNLTFTKGNGARRIVLCKASAAISAAPTTGIGYTANSVFGAGSQIGSGNYVVYSDTGTTFSLTGLTANTTYYFAVFEYNGIGGSSNYLTTAFNYLTGSQATTNTIYYYSKSTGNLDAVSTWGTNVNGTGTSPSNFTSANCYYFAINNAAPTISSNLVITGGNTALIIGDGVNTFNFTIPAGLAITTDTFVLKKFSSITVNGSLNGVNNIFEDTTTAQFLSTSVQNIPTASYYNLITGSSVKTLNNGNVVARNSLTLMASINLNNYILMLGTSISQLGTLNFVTGTIYGGAFWRWFAASTNTGTSGLFPVGTSTNYRPIQINYTSAPTTGGVLAASFNSNIPTNTGLPQIDINTSPIITINKVGKNGTWLLTPGALAGGQFTTTITAAGFYGVSSYADLRIVRRTNSSAAWTLTGTALVTTGSNASPILSRTGMNAFGEFGVGGDSTTNALPVKLIILTVHQNNKDAILNWQTASEINSDYFELMQSMDAINWKRIGKVDAAGNSTDLKSYQFTDRELSTINQELSTVYYQLKQFDRDGSVSNSNIVTLDLKKLNNSILLFPLPIKNILKAISQNNEVVNQITIYDLNGKDLVSSNANELDVSWLAQGIYIAKVVTDKETYFQKISK